MSDRNITRPKHALGSTASPPVPSSPTDTNVNWANAAETIEADQKVFEKQTHLLGSAGPFNFGNLGNDGTPNFGFMSTSSIQPAHPDLSCSQLEMSWGAFFAKKSPPMGDLYGSGFDRPHFSSPAHLAETPQRQMNGDAYQSEALLTKSFVNDQDAFSQPFKSPSVVSQFHRGAFRIQVPQLEFVQRFYQFGVKLSVMDEMEGIKPQIDSIIEEYLRTEFDDKSRPIRSFLTYQREMRRCTLLLIFPSRRHSQNEGNSKTGANASKDHDLNNLILRDKTSAAVNARDGQPEMADEDSNCEWINNFLQFPAIARILDTTADPAFTQISAGM